MRTPATRARPRSRRKSSRNPSRTAPIAPTAPIPARRTTTRDNTAGGDATTKNHADDANSTTSSKQDTGNYADGDYSVNGQYGPVGEDSIDVHLTIKDGNVETVNIIGHPFTTISKNHQDDFAKAINGVVDGKPLKGLKVDKVAGASWTSDAFNKALEVARQEASIQE